MTHVIHEIPPVFDTNSQILILGSFPSVKSREGQFFYHHKQNRFWKVLSAVVNDTLPETIDEKKDFLLKAAPIRQIYTNGGTAYKLYHKYCEKITGIKAVKLPSTSPANASYSLDRLIDQWKLIAHQISKD